MDDVPQLSEHMRLLKVEDALKLATQFFEERILKLGLFFCTLVTRFSRALRDVSVVETRFAHDRVQIFIKITMSRRLNVHRPSNTKST